MKDWIMGLCPEIVAWQAELIAEEAQKRVLAERNECVRICCEHWLNGGNAIECADAIRERDKK